MATYVLLLKESESDEYVIYKFGPNSEKIGRVQLNKKTGEYLQLNSVPGAETTFYFNRAVSKLLKHLRSGNGFPEQTHFAS